MATEYKNPKVLDVPNNENPDKKFESIVDEPAEIKQKSLWERAWDQFFHYDGKTLSEHIVLNMIVPSAQNIVSGVLKNIIDSFFDTNGSQGGGYSLNSYDQYYNRSNRGNRSRSNYVIYDNDIDYRYIALPYGKAIKLKDDLDYAISRYGKATVGDLLDLTGHSPTPADYRHGWLDLRNVKIVGPVGKDKEGCDLYRLTIPEALPLDF